MEKDRYNKKIVYWLLSGALLILVMVIIGGITRLTGSGLSIVEWNLLSGILPPLTQAAWQATFEKYKLFPEYQKFNFTMTLADFKEIFWWEYIHRLLGRIIGIVFIVPFLYFLVKKQVSNWLLKRLLLILALGMAQGLIGWLMVKSGLVDVPHVSHFRLAAHLLLALLLIGVIIWTVADMTAAYQPSKSTTVSIVWLPKLVLAVLLVQIVYGAFVAGLKAGFTYNTYPLMEGEIFPSHMNGFLSWVAVFENGVAVQFIHRWVAVVLLLAILWFWNSTRKTDAAPVARNSALLLLLLGLFQMVLGVATLLLYVPVVLGVLHQVVAVAMFAMAVLAVHQFRFAGSSQEVPTPDTSPAATTPAFSS